MVFKPRQPKREHVQPMPLHTFRAVDLESNGTDVDACEVAQVAIDSASAVDGRPVLSGLRTSMVYCSVDHMPKGATKVHGLTAEQLSEHKPFVCKVRPLMKALTAPGVIVVTFNGARFDLAVIARYADRHGKLSAMIEDVPGAEARTRAGHRDAFEDLLAVRHIDVYRLWQVAIARKVEPPWQSSVNVRVIAAYDHAAYAPMLPMAAHAGGFNGSLTGAHMFWMGQDFDGAHDASADNRATLRVLGHMLGSGFVDIDQAMRLTSGPLPGDVDFEGVFKWDGDQAICNLAKFRDEPIEKVDRGFLQWMLEPKQSFHRHTKQVVREYLAGRYPIRAYENENT